MSDSKFKPCDKRNCELYSYSETYNCKGMWASKCKDYIAMKGDKISKEQREIIIVKAYLPLLRIEEYQHEAKMLSFMVGELKQVWVEGARK